MALNKESRTVNVGKNATSALFNKFAILILTFISRRFFIQYIGVEYLGINGLFSNILTLLSMADLGLGTAMNVSLYKPIAENDEKKLAALLSYFKQIYYFIAIAVTVIGLGLIPFLPYIVNLDSNIPHLYLFYVIFILKNTVSYLFVYKSSIISADQKNYLINRIDLLVNFSRVVIQIVVMILFKNYLAYILVELLGIMIHNFAISFIADKQYPFIRNQEELSKEEKKSFFTDMYSAFLYKVAGSILNGTDNVLISIIVSTIAVGLYSNYSTITHNLELFIMLLFNSLTASVGNLVATSSSNKRYEAYKSMQMIGNWMGSYISICLFYLIQDFMLIWLHDSRFVMDNYVLFAIVINMYYTICMRPVWTFREGTGMYKQIRFIMFATAVVNLILSVVLGKLIGVGGILIATTIAKLFTCFWYEPSLLFKGFFGVKPISYYKDYSFNIIITLFAGTLCYFPLQLLSNIQTGIGAFLLKGIICTIIINIVFFIRYYKTAEFSFIKHKILQLKNR